MTRALKQICQIVCLLVFVGLLAVALVYDRTYLGLALLWALCWFVGEAILPRGARPFHWWWPERKQE